MIRSLVSFCVSIVSSPIQYLKSLVATKSDDENSDILVQAEGESESLDQHDHPLLKKHTDFRSYATSYATYPSIRTFYHPHAHTNKLKAIADLPLLVFIHGLGGSLPQFAPLLGTFVNVAPAFGIEWPGHGLSTFAPANYEAYEFDALVELWRVAIQDACATHGHTKVVLVAHSLGCSVAGVLASTTTKAKAGLDVDVAGIVAICPKAGPPTPGQVRSLRFMMMLPDWVVDIMRWFDRYGGESSKSVTRFVGKSAGVDLKRLQLRFNREFSTAVWKRTLIGCCPSYDFQGTPRGGLPGKDMWKGVKVPLFLIAGDSDAATPPKESQEIFAFVRGRSIFEEQKMSDSAVPVANDHVHQDLDTGDEGEIVDKHANDTEFGVSPATIETDKKHSSTVKAVKLPAPASHALMYDHATYRTVAGLIEDFLSRQVSPQLGLDWQLQQLTTSGKWDVKNLEKWKRVVPVSGPIDHGLFRALKTLREQDEEHTPVVFLRNWKDKIFALIDISHDSPIYDTNALEKGGVQYHKFPTVSKIPPTLIEVQAFIELVDRLRAEIKKSGTDSNVKPAIGVHCHYGYNRTGFFIVCYLIEKRGYRVQDAIEEFARHKPPGIRHDHFIDTLFVRYCVGLRRSSTFK